MFATSFIITWTNSQKEDIQNHFFKKDGIVNIDSEEKKDDKVRNSSDTYNKENEDGDKHTMKNKSEDDKK